ncbi:MAG TPA: hypothetical protein VI078_02115, partial [bacterium]
MVSIALRGLRDLREEFTVRPFRVALVVSTLVHAGLFLWLGVGAAGHDRTRPMLRLHFITEAPAPAEAAASAEPVPAVALPSGRSRKEPVAPAVPLTAMPAAQPAAPPVEPAAAPPVAAAATVAAEAAPDPVVEPAPAAPAPELAPQLVTAPAQVPVV